MTSPLASSIEPLHRRRGKRILAWPRELRLNPMLGAIHDDLERGFGWRVARFSYWHALVNRYAILHVSFPSIVFRNRSQLITLARYTLTLGSMRLAKMFGRRIAWTVHNLADHESYHPRLEAKFMGHFTDMLDLVVHLSEAGRGIAVARHPRLAGKPEAVIPHPHYGRAAGGGMPRDAALATLGLPADCKLILAFGVVRRYKNLLKLIRAFNDLPPRESRLLVAGMPLDARLADAMRKIAGERVSLMLRGIEEPEITTLFSAATLVVAPYLDILNSGTAFMSLTHGRPILVPDRGAMKDLRKQVGPDWVKLFDAPLTPLVLGDALHWAAAPRHAPPDLSPFTPERITAAYARVFDNLI